MNCIYPIPSVENNLKNIYLGGTLWDESTSQYYNDNNDTFELLFKIYTAINVDNIYHPSIFNERTDNMYKAYYEDNQDLGAYIFSEKSN